MLGVWTRFKAFGRLAGHWRRAQRSAAQFAALEGAYRGRTIFCIGSGPSLKSQDLSGLTGQIALLCNHALFLRESIKFERAHPVVQDSVRVNELHSALIQAPDASFVSMHSFDWPLLDQGRPDPRLAYFMPKLSMAETLLNMAPRISHASASAADPRRGLFLGRSVIFSAVQIAQYLGATRIVLVGVEMDYTGDPAKDYAFGGIRNQHVMDYARDCRPHLSALHHALERRGVRLVNATIGGKIDVLDRVSIDEVRDDARA